VTRPAPLPAETPLVPRGLPDHLPEGETLLWQGAPSFRQLAVSAFHIRKVAVYFAILLAWRIGTGIGDGLGALEIAQGSAPLAALSALGIGTIALLAWLSAATTVYSITSKRVVLRVGIALPITVNIPFHAIVAADVRRGAGVTGDIALTLPAGQRIAYLHLWPHVRPWQMKRPKPMLRALPDLDRAAAVLAPALAAATGGSAAGLHAIARDRNAAETGLPSGLGLAAE
jgi:hypothetical protein